MGETQILFRCKKCHHGFDYAEVYERWSNGDYGIYFDITCPGCEREIEVQVETIPEFSLVRPTSRTDLDELKDGE